MIKVSLDFLEDFKYSNVIVSVKTQEQAEQIIDAAMLFGPLASSCISYGGSND